MALDSLTTNDAPSTGFAPVGSLAVMAGAQRLERTFHALKLADDVDPDLLALVELAGAEVVVATFVEALAHPTNGLAAATDALNTVAHQAAAAALGRVGVSISKAAILAPRIHQALGAHK